LNAAARGRVARVGLVAVAAMLLAFAAHLGLFRELRDPARLAQDLVDLGPRGYAAFIIAYALLQPFGVPGTVFILAAPLIWPWPVAFALSMTGTMAASVVGFSFARFVARDWVASMVPARFRAYEEALERRALVTVFVLRFVFWMPPPLHVFFGVSRVGFWTHFWGSLAGYVVPLFLVSFFGQKLFDWLKSAPPAAWIALGVVVAGAFAVGLALRRRARSATASK
jgi:uncharacterized membrane protein YdjX (TVP38/TMEM64 family)